ncbi:transmembrane protein, putative (macronuclear) [Tetrahymena thermophila SB210]|uniref:Transmembrane protein, putative n=1 Tax=Tetrahymena thermophila (strain SB210) TaxID=312017 RepID=Q23EE9_TETTS|nr:transmembrane protein, putative [Tetrahymena thermophila SB210]EAR94908.2 transmembrane protein, putative [Tetrahymena thermophila SB210]|eukprot:XP_001015153.2 transmembrane protein, putative [Tetrahymena thermophila SB210]
MKQINKKINQLIIKRFQKLEIVMKIKLVLLALCIYLSAVLVKSKKLKPSCSYHATFYKTRIILTKILYHELYKDTQAKQLNDALQKQFLNSKPSIKSEDDLGVCSEYAGENSCCNINMVKLIDQAAFLKVKPLQQAKSAFQKFINIYKAQINENCHKNINDENILSNENLKILQENKQKQADCKVNFAKSISSFTRGVLCTMCAGVDQLEDYFNNNKQLKISPTSSQTFEKNTQEAIQCHEQIFNQANIELMVKELNSFYIQTDHTCGDVVVKNIKSIFKNHKIHSEDSEHRKTCRSDHVYGDNSHCENILQGNKDLESKTQRFLTFEDEYLNINRLLQETTDAVIDSNGVNIYKPSDTDQNIDESGDQIKPNFDGIDTNNSLSLISSIFICLVFLII